MARTTTEDEGRRRAPRRRRAVEPAGSASSPDAAPPRWLDRTELAAWSANSALMVSLPAALDARMQRSAGITFFEYMVLSVLSEQPDVTLQMSGLATRTASSLSRLSHVVRRLEERGLVERARVPGAGRRTNATLTPAGREVVVAAAPDHVAAVREYLVDDLSTDDLEALTRIGAAVEAAISRRLGGDAPGAARSGGSTA